MELIKKNRTEASFIATVSKGTYIRTLAHDIAHALGTVGVVTRLHRLTDGPFEIKDSVPLDGHLNLLPLDFVLDNLPKLNVSEEIAQRIQKGQRIKEPSITKGITENIPVLILHQDHPIAIVRIKEDVIHPNCVF